MNVLAINGSPHMDDGNTAKILNPFLEGMKDAGAKVELYFTKKLNIGPCNGDMSCWFVNPGKCGQKDDMQMLLPKLREADIIVYATPVYYAGITGPLKNLMDRQLPQHVMGDAAEKKQKIALVSTCGAWELSMFDPLLVQMKAIYSHPEGGSEFVGALLRPMADGMTEMIKAGETGKVEGVLKAAREAGRQLVKDGRISEETLKAVSKELMPQDAYYKAAEAMMEQIKKAAKEKCGK
ncbi:MAG: Iron-sulfur flavoprotein [Methanosaeta sp. PtaU1.Bin060]|jgi:multimeric flavodoxin WrbA|nr:MAG: Iron-sulfur flavoprotein [Methanosaeta sp. PtaU1.Bin060]